MTGESLLEVERGDLLGNISIWAEDGELIRNVGRFREGIIPEGSILASPYIHAYIAESFSGHDPEEVVIAISSDEESGEPIVGVEARSAKSHEPLSEEVDSDLLIGALRVAIRESSVEAARIDPEATNVIPELEEHAEEVGLEEGDSGELVVRPIRRFTVHRPLQSVW
jgi:hypothetical protein